jgi:hypothetical protein
MISTTGIDEEASRSQNGATEKSNLLPGAFGPLRRGGSDIYDSMKGVIFHHKHETRRKVIWAIFVLLLICFAAQRLLIGAQSYAAARESNEPRVGYDVDEHGKKVFVEWAL